MRPPIPIPTPIEQLGRGHVVLGGVGEGRRGYVGMEMRICIIYIGVVSVD
jgi:hypothetical protein